MIGISDVTWYVYLLFIFEFPFLCTSRCHLDMSTFNLGTNKCTKLT